MLPQDQPPTGLPPHEPAISQVEIDSAATTEALISIQQL